MMIDLLVAMLERLGIIVTVAFVLTRLHFFRDMIYQGKLNFKKQLMAILFFGFFGIMGTYFGMTLDTSTHQFDSGLIHLSKSEAIANSRVIGIVIAGMLGGFRVGIGAGLLAGIHRYMLGGFTALSCSISTIVAGFIAGFFYKKGRQLKLKTAFMIAALIEALQMGIILLMSKPFDKALVLVDMIGIPMIVANGVGAALFLLIIKNVINEEEKAVAFQAQKTLRIANQALFYLRDGLTRQASKAICHILYREINIGAVAMTNRFDILAHVGIGDDHHQAGYKVQTKITREVIQTGETKMAPQNLIHCQHANCPLGAVIVAPLKVRHETVGTLKFYFRTESEITDIDIELIGGLSTLLSNQLAIADAEHVYKLAKDAEIKALQAQISPHFLFNSLNVITSLIRIQPQKARKLLISLSTFLRQNVTNTTVELVTLEQELKHVKAYLMIAEERFVDRLRVQYTIDHDVLGALVPPLTLQPIVENAVKHGIKDMDHNCMIHISIQLVGENIVITVQDNGKGMTQKQIDMAGNKKVDSTSGTGLGLYNVNQRLSNICGEQSMLCIHSTVEKGTEVSFSIQEGRERHGKIS